MIQEVSTALKVFMSQREQQRRWRLTVSRGFVRFLVQDGMILIPLLAQVFVSIFYYVGFHRMPYVLEYAIAYVCALFYSIPWCFAIWRKRAKTL